MARRASVPIDGGGEHTEDEETQPLVHADASTTNITASKGASATHLYMKPTEHHHNLFACSTSTSPCHLALPRHAVAGAGILCHWRGLLSCSHAKTPTRRRRAGLPTQICFLPLRSCHPYPPWRCHSHVRHVSGGQYATMPQQCHRPGRSTPKWQHMPAVALLGLFLFLNQGLFIVGLQHAGALLASCLQPAIPTFTHMLAVALRIERCTILGSAGIVLAMVGAACMVGLFAFVFLSCPSTYEVFFFVLSQHV